jgi:ribonuclease Z
MSTIMPLLRLAWDTDFRIRCCTFTDTNLDFPLSGVKVEEQDLKEGVVYSHNGVKVTAFKVDHRPVQPAFGFRVDYQGKSVVFSGDTRLSENLIKHSVGVNLLIHEVYGFARDTGAEIFDYHTPPEDAARIFNADAPELAVYTHMGIPPGNTFKDIESRTRAAGYLGPLQSGADLMQINVMANGVTVIPPAANAAAKPAVVPNVQSQQLKRMVP